MEARPPRDASTVLLLRDGTAGPEVFVVRRVAGMAFAGGMTVFPGGGVDPGDDDPTLRWSGPAPSWWAGRLGVDEARARRLVCAAARETFEECGVLLAVDGAGRPVADVAVHRAARRALEAHKLGFARFLHDAGLALDSASLRPVDHWITPVVEPRRYDTRFFLAVVPEGQEPDGDTGEVDEHRWARPAEVLDDFAAGRITLLPPTWTRLRRLAAAGSVRAAMADEPAITPVEPRPYEAEGRTRVRFPDSDEYWRTVDAARRDR